MQNTVDSSNYPALLSNFKNYIKTLLEEQLCT